MTWATTEIPGIGGVYKDAPGDFEVEEIPLYPCSGIGEHLYLWVEKTGITTSELVTRIARHLRINEREIGYAGLKDSRALTRQWLSIPADKEPSLTNLQLGNAQILDVQRHSNKLRQGHLAGNRFTICLRQISADAVHRAEAILAILADRGIPNRFGEQRYGVLGNSARLGELLLAQNHEALCRELIGDPEQIEHPGWHKAACAYRQGDLKQALDCLPQTMRVERQLVRDLLQGKNFKAAVLSIPKQRLRFFLSAAQSSYFDQLLNARINNLGQLLPGDVAYKHANGACFRVIDATAEQPRADRFEISPTAPLYGYKGMLAEQLPGAAEIEMLEKSGLTLADWKLGRGLEMPGERRPLRVPFLEKNAIVAATDDSLTLRFSLPKGSYATSVLREIVKQ